ncbi:MAG TPA: serine/threonine-protein kinase [Polyangiaceae bacterium]
MPDCPSDDTFAAFIENRLDGAKLEAFFQHSRDCRSCTATLAALARQPSDAEPSLADDPLSQRAPLTPRPEIGGRYIAQAILGAGGMGIVYLAQDNRLNRQVALKLTHKGMTQSAIFRMMREAQAMAQLSHKNVVTVYDVGTWQGHVFIAMEYLQGGTLSRYLLERSPSPEDILELFLQAGRGLVAAHSAGIVHRDFKPDNVLLGANGEARVADFGLARWYMNDPRFSNQWLDTGAILSQQSLRPELVTRLGTMIGTPAYMPPEQLKGLAVDQRADIWSFSAALYEALHCELPFPGRTPAEVLTYVERGAVRAPPEGSRVPGWLRRALLRGLRADPDERYATLSELLEVIERRSATSHKRVLGWVFGLLIATSVLVALGVFRARAERDVSARLSALPSVQVTALADDATPNSGTAKQPPIAPDPAQRSRTDAAEIQVVPVGRADLAFQAPPGSTTPLKKPVTPPTPPAREPATANVNPPQQPSLRRAGARAKDHLRGF